MDKRSEHFTEDLQMANKPVKSAPIPPCQGDAN